MELDTDFGVKQHATENVQGAYTRTVPKHQETLHYPYNAVAELDERIAQDYVLCVTVYYVLLYYSIVYCVPNKSAATCSTWKSDMNAGLNGALMKALGAPLPPFCI